MNGSNCAQVPHIRHDMQMTSSSLPYRITSSHLEHRTSPLKTSILDKIPHVGALAAARDQTSFMAEKTR